MQPGGENQLTIRYSHIGVALDRFGQDISIIGR